MKAVDRAVAWTNAGGPATCAIRRVPELDQVLDDRDRARPVVEETAGNGDVAVRTVQGDRGQAELDQQVDPRIVVPEVGQEDPVDPPVLREPPVPGLLVLARR